MQKTSQLIIGFVSRCVVGFTERATRQVALPILPLGSWLMSPICWGTPLAAGPWRPGVPQLEPGAMPQGVADPPRAAAGEGPTADSLPRFTTSPATNWRHESGSFGAGVWLHAAPQGT